MKGESLIASGGRTFFQNNHVVVKDQRFALDILALKPGSPIPSTWEMKISNIDTYEGNPKQNENYYCFGREVVAPADGVVVDAMSNVPDNVPGKMNKKQAPGNYVVIDHGNNEYSMMAHFKKNSVKVIKGKTVNAGDIIGLIGNSGNSSEPHLHYHLQNTPKWFEGEGLPAQFINYIANDKLVKRGEPVQGEIISTP